MPSGYGRCGPGKTRPGAGACRPPERPGDKTDYLLAGGGFQVKIARTTSRVCPPGDGTWESVDYLGQLTASAPAGTTGVAVWGSCGY